MKENIKIAVCICFGLLIGFWGGVIFGEFQALKIGVDIMAKYLGMTNIDSSKIAQALQTYYFSGALG